MRRALAVLLIALALVLAVGGSGAFDSAEVDRSSTISVADDPDAYVGIDREECKVTNQADRTLDFTLESDDYQEIEDLEPGDSAEVKVNGSTTVSIDGMDLSATMERTFDCTDAESDSE